MSRIAPLIATAILLVTAISPTVAEDKATSSKEKNVPTALNFKMKSLAGKPVNLADYHGKVVLVVNVASQCGLTPQYEALQALHEHFGPQGLVVVGVPCNQFGGQEPGTAKEISTFCKDNYGVTFTMLEKVDVNGDKACDLYQHLTSLPTKPKGSGKIAWNFEKFLIGRDGEVVARFEPSTRPDSNKVLQAIKTALAKS